MSTNKDVSGSYRYERRKKQSNDNKSSDGAYRYERITQRRLPEIGEYLNSSISNWLKENESFYKSYNDRVSRYDGKDALDWTYESDSADWLSSVTTQTTNLKQGAKEILSWLDQYKDYLDADYYVSVKKAINDNVGQYGGVISTATDIHSHWSNWETEDAYNKYVAQEKDYNEKLSFNLEAGKVEISGLESQYGKASNIANELSSLTQTLKSGYTRAGYSEDKIEELIANDSRIVALKNQLAQYGDPSALASTLSEKKAYYTLAERAQKAVEFASVADVESENYDPEFEKYANQGQSMDDGNTPWMFFGNTVADNPIEAWRRYYADYPSVEEDYGAGKIGNEASFALAMTEDEVNVYNYYLAKEGKDKAEEYLDLIAESVNSRVASGLFSQVQDKPVLEYAFAVASGLDQFASGIEGWFADGYTPTSSIQMASGMVREDLADTGSKLPDWLGGSSTGQVFYDFVNTTSNMLPSILVGAVTNPIVGTSLLGASAGGNAKAEMLNLGYSKEQATAYGVMVGAAEASMEYLLGGITKLGGKLSGKAVSAIASKVDNAIARVAIKLGNKGGSLLKAIAHGTATVAGKMGSEALEESLQTVIEPWLKEIATGVDWEDPSIDEVLYSGLLGALSAFGLEGAGVVAGEVNTYKKGQTIRNTDGGVGKLQNLATNYFSADTVAYKIASKVNAQTDAYTIGRLLNEVGGTISEQNVTEIANGLMAKGFGKNTANKLARQYQAILNADMNISEEAKKILNETYGLDSVLRENLINKNTTVYQRTKAYSDLMNLAEETANNKNGKTTESKVDTLESLAYAVSARGVDSKVAGFMASKAKSDLTKPTTEARTFEQSEIDAMEKIASEVASGKSISVSERAVKEKVKEKSDSANTVAKGLGVDGLYTSTNTGKTWLDSSRRFPIQRSEVNIVGVDSTEGGLMKLKLDDGTVVDADEIDFRTSDEALVYEAVANMGVSANTAWEILKAYDPKSGQSGTIYAMGALEAYNYGYNGIKADGMSQDGFSSLLSPVQKNTANRLGEIDAKAKKDAEQKAVDDKQKTIDKAVKSVRDEARSKHKAIPKRQGGVVFEGNHSKLKEHQQHQLDVLEKVAEGLGVTFHIFESDKHLRYKMPDGKIKSTNGWYDPKTNEIWIDLKAGNDGEGTIIFTAAHELTHFIKQWSPAKFKIFADFLVEQYGKHGQDVNQLVLNQMKKAAGNKRMITWDEAYEEVIADSCETFLRDSKAAEKIAALRERDVNLANKIKSFLGQMLAKMRKVMADLKLLPNTEEGQMVAKMTDSLEKLYNLWADALADAGQAYSTLADIDFNTESVAPMLSERTWTASEYVTEREKTAKEISKALGVDIKTAYKYIDDINSVARLIADDRARLDYEPNLDEHATVLKPNSDYKYSVDMSTLCAKRLLFTGTFDAIQRALPNTVFDSEDIVALREMMQKRGYEVACGICYVESTRREIGRITQDFINSYKESQKTGKPITRTNSEGKVVDLKKTNDEKKATADKSTDKFFAEKDYTPTLADLNTTDIDLVKRDHPLVYEAYLNFMNARGQAKPKLLETRAEYKGEILTHFKAKNTVTARNNAGGLRLQSFSDFEVPHLIDMMQIVMDMSRVDLKSQAYTKVPAFAEVFGDTGVKINLSLIAKGDGLDANGNLVFDDVEGINHNEAFKLRDKYSKNVGTILVGKTDAHIIAAMADPRIDYIIPFHKSSWKESLYDALGLTGYADYTDTQHEKAIDKNRGKIKDFDPSEYWDFSKSGDENAQIYLAKCREDGRIPKFPQFQGYPGYWKLLIDFKMYDNDGVGSPQEVVRPTFNTEASERILSEYKGGHKSFPVAKDVVEDFVREHQDKGIRYSTRETLAEASSTLASISDEDYLKDKEANPFVLVMEHTPKIVLDSMEGGSDRKILIRRDALYLAIRENGIQPGHYHGLGDKVLSELPKYLEEPDAILSTDDNESRRLVLSHIPVKNGQAIISIEFESIKDFEGSKEYFNVVITVFDLHENYLKRLFKKNGAEIKYKKEDLAQSNPQLYEWLRIINAKSPKDSIAQVPDSVNRDTEKNSLRNVEPIETSDYVEMYHHFGSTKNYDVAGYILGNGIMLDFSGKHWGDDYSTTRQVDHRDIQETLGNRGSNNGVNAMIDMIGNGNIRLMPEVGGINLAVKPNSTQMSQLRGYINHFKGEVTIDIDEVGGDTIHSFSYTRGTSSAKVLADIKAYFDEGIVPKQKEDGETDIHQFLYSDRDSSYSEGLSEADKETAKEVIKGLKIHAQSAKYGIRSMGTYTEERMDREIKHSSSDTVLDYAKSYITWVSPIDFIYATTTSEQYRQILKEEAGDLNIEKLRAETQPIHLTVDFETGEIVGHEGRHRMLALQKAGVEKVAVVIDAWNDDRHNTKPIEIKQLKGQNFGGIGRGTGFFLHDMLPLSARYAEVAKSLFSLDPKNGVRFSDRSPSSVSTRSLLANALETTAQNDVEKNKLAQYKSKIELIESEYAKLAEIKKKANDIRFTKGRTAAETKQMKALEFEANQIANRINVYDRQLFNLESTTALKNVLQREKELARRKEAQKGKEALAKQKEREAKTIRTLMDKNTESRKKAAERADKTTMRRKIRKLVKELNSWLKNSNKKKNVKQELQDTVATSLALAEVLFNDEIRNEDIVRLGVDSITEQESILLNEYRDLLEQRDALVAKIESTYENGLVKENTLTEVGSIEEALAKVKNRISTLNGKLSEVFERERTRLNKVTMNAVFDALISEYSNLADSDNDYIKNAYSEVMKTRLETLKKDLDGKIAKDMSVHQLAEVYDAFVMIKHMISTANGIFREGRIEDLATYVSNTQGEIFESTTEPKDRGVVADAVVSLFNEFSWNNLRPVDAFERLGSKTFEKLFWDYIHGMGTAARDVAEAGEAIANAREKYGYSKWKMNLADTAYTTREGLTFKPSLADKLSIYAFSKREKADGTKQAMDHMVDGGFTYDTGRTYKDVENGKTYVRRKLSTTYRLSEGNIKSIIDSLTQEQRDYVDAILPYLTDMGMKGNEVSMTLYGIELFGDKVYFPLQSSADYLSSTTQELGATQTMSSLANSGFTKQTTPGANNPIVLRGFDDVVLEHIEKMSNYHGLVIPIENLRRVFDNVSRDTEKNSLSTKALIGSRYGVEAQKYFAQLLIDLNGGMSPSGAKSILGKLFSRGKAMAVSANLSVVAQQYFAIVRAMEVVAPKYFTPFLNSKTKSTDIKEYEELKKYAPIAIIKEMNGFDVGSSGRVKNYIGNVGARKDAKYIKDKIDDASMWGAGKMDELGWVTIWKAVKAEVASEQKLAPGTEEFYKACNTRFTEVVTKTQVYDSVASRSGYMRSKSDAVKYATSFMGEPTVTMGRYFVNGINLVRAIKSKDSGKIKEASLRFARAATVIAISQVLGNLAKSLIYAGRDDEEDEAFLEKWAKNFAEALVSDLNPLNSLPFTRDIMSIIEGWDVERPDLTLIADAITSTKKMFDDDITFDESLNFIGAVGNLLGIPFKNVIREIKSAVNVVDDIFVDDISPTDMGGAFVEGLTGEERTKQNNLYNAIIRGDTSKIEAIKGTYKTDSAYESAVKSALRENDSRIKEAAKAHSSGDIRSFSNYIDTIVAEGHFDRETVEGAIRAEQSAFNTKINKAAEAKNKGEDAEHKKIVRELRDSYRGIYSQDEIVSLVTKAQEEQLATEDEDVEEATSIYKASDINDAFESGDTDMALEVIDDLIKTKVANGMTEKEAKSSIRSSMTSYWKPLYKEAYKSGNTAEKERIERILKASGLYGSASEVIKTCREWRTERD